MKDHYITVGKEHVIIKNPKNPEHGFSFRGRIKDAIEAVKEGKGDLVVTNLCISDETPVSAGTFYRETVVRFLDREYGEQERRKFLEEIEQQGEIIYKYTIICIDQPDKTYSVEVDNDENRLIYFSSEEKAKEFLDEYANMLFSYFINMYQKKLEAIKQFPELNINLSETDRLIFFFTKDLDYSFEPTVDFFKNKFQIVQMI